MTSSKKKKKEKKRRSLVTGAKTHVTRLVDNIYKYRIIDIDN